MIEARRHAWNHKPGGEQECVRCGLRRRHVEKLCVGLGLNHFLKIWEYSRDGINWTWINSRQPVPVCTRRPGHAN